MKIAVVFLLAALTSSFDAASVSQYNCLELLFKQDAPALLQSIATLLCDYKTAKAQQNALLFENFLQKVNALLTTSQAEKDTWPLSAALQTAKLLRMDIGYNNIWEKVGCTIDNILGTQVTITIQDAEQLGDQVANVLFGFVDSIIAKVMKILDDIPFIDDILNDKPLSTDIRDVSCEIMVGVITDLDKVLKFVTTITENLAQRTQ